MPTATAKWAGSVLVSELIVSVAVPVLMRFIVFVRTPLVSGIGLKAQGGQPDLGEIWWRAGVAQPPDPPRLTGDCSAMPRSFVT